MFKSVTTLGGAVAVLLWFTGPAWAPRSCGGCVITKPGSKSVVNPSDKTFKGGKATSFPTETIKGKPGKATGGAKNLK